MNITTPPLPKHILLAEDDQDDRYFFKLALETLPVPTRLTTVNDGEALIDWLFASADALPDFLFLDINMPKMNGIECLGVIRADDRFKHLPVIIFSSAYAPQVIKQLYSNGAQYYVRKPTDIDEYKNVIYKALHVNYTIV